MKRSILASAISLLSATIQAAETISNANTPPVTVMGNAFFAGSKRFYIRGIDYQPGGSSLLTDPLANTAICKRDIAKFKELAINTVRIYTVDNSANHDECMKLLADAGIYLALDVNSPNYSLNRGGPGLIHKSYNEVYLQNVFATIDKFAKYDNTLLFFSGNEVINEPKNSFAAPYIKSVTRDMKNYMKARSYRAVPVGYSAADITENRYQMATYMNCGPEETRSDFFAFNDYSWCNSDINTSGWIQKVQQYSDYSRPIFLSEFGCQAAGPRRWNEVGALYSDKMTSVYSGGLVYEYTMEANKFGIVQVKGDSVQTLAEFDVLKDAFAKTPMPTTEGGYKPNLPPSQCPAESHPNWPVSGTAIPKLPEGARKFFQNGAGAGVGLKGAGSQTAGTPSPGWSDGSGEGPRNVVANNAGNSAPGTSKATPVIVIPPITSIRAVTTATSTSAPAVTSPLSNVDAVGAKATGSTKKNSAMQTRISGMLAGFSALVMVKML